MNGAEMTSQQDCLFWEKASAPSLADFEALAERAYAALPQRFTQFCAHMILCVEDFPDEETLEAMECETEFDILGLFAGQGLTDQSATEQTGALPNKIILYRRPILDYWAENDETLGDVVRHVLIHEIGHHFGLSDEDMERIEDSSEDI